MCWVYAYNVAPGYTKVGYSETNWNLRVKHVKGWMSDDPQLVGLWHVEGREGERTAHAILHPYRIQGRRELFALHGDRCIALLTAEFGPIAAEANLPGESSQLELPLV